MTRKLLKAAIVGLIFTSIATTASAFTAVLSGDWNSAATWGGVSPGSNVSGQDINIPSGISVNLNTDVAFSGLLNSFTVNGALTNATEHSVTMSQGTFAGTGSINIDRLSFSGFLTTMSYSGTMTVNRFENMGSALTLAAVVSVADTLNLDAGSILLGSGANLGMMSGSVIRVNDGTLTIGGGVFNSGSSYSVLYVGSTKTSGIELNTTTLDELYVQLDDNTQSLTLAANLDVHGDAHFDSGIMNINSRQLRLQGDVMMGAGTTFTTNSTSSLIIAGSTTLSSGLAFTSGATIGDLTIYTSASGDVKIVSDLNVASDLNLMDGKLSIESSSDLTMNAGSTVHIEGGEMMLNGGTFDGSAAYNVEYMGGNATSGLELTGSGLNNLTVDLTSTSDMVTLNNDVTINGALNMVDGKVKLNGNTLTVDGTFSQNSTSMFVGNTTSELELTMATSVNDTLYFSQASGENMLSKLTVNSPASTIMYLGNSLTIVDELALTAGRLDIGGNDLVIQSSGMITGYDENNYIVTSGAGKLQMRVNSASTYVTFPVGTTTGYSPASVQQTATGTNGDFMVNTAEGVYSNGTMSGWNSAEHGSMVNRTWWISSAGGVTVNSNIKLGWEAADEVNAFDRSNAYITHYTGGAWDTHSMDAATSTSYGFELERTGLTSLSPFAVVDSTAGISIGIEETAKPVSMSLYPNPATDYVNIQINNTSDEYSYELLDITGSVLKAATNSNVVNKFDVANLSMGYYFIRATNTTTKEVITKRIVKN